MSYPNTSGKHRRKAFFSAAHYLSYLKKIHRYPTRPAPKNIILCYQRRFFHELVSKHRLRSADGFLEHTLYFLDNADGDIGLLGNFGIGAPAAVTKFEELIAMGARRFVSIGLAGTLQKDIGIGDIVLSTRAIRDEGISHHYCKPSKYSYPSKPLTQRLKAVLAKQGCPLHLGTSWTIDAIYRETAFEAKRYQAEGVATVEMEAAALFSVASRREVELASAFVVSDSLADLKWHPDMYNKTTWQALTLLYQSAASVLAGPHRASRVLRR